jgi:hypothetical protein
VGVDGSQIVIGLLTEGAKVHVDKFLKPALIAALAELLPEVGSVRVVVREPEVPGIAVVGQAIPPVARGQTIEEQSQVVERVARRLVDESERFKRRDGGCPEFFVYPVSLMFPWRVIRVAKDKDGNPIPLQNLWFGRSGRFVHAIHGGLDKDGNPMGIPGHSFPLLVGICLTTEYKYPLDKGTVGPRICLGDTLADFARACGYKGAFRGEKAKRFLERLYQYFACTHRIIEFATDDDALAFYKEITAAGFVPSREELAQSGRLAKSDDPTKVHDPDYTMMVVGSRRLADYNIWTQADIARDWNERGPFGWVVLTDEYVTKFATHGVPLSTHVLAALLKNAQDVALYTYLTQRVFQLRKEGHKSVTIRLSSFQDHLGINRTKENRRPSGMIKAIRERVAPAWDAAAMAMGKPECCFRYTLEEGHSRFAARITLFPTPPLIDRPGGQPQD